MIPKKQRRRTLMISDNSWLISAWNANVSVSASSPMMMVCFSSSSSKESVCFVKSRFSRWMNNKWMKKILSFAFFFCLSLLFVSLLFVSLFFFSKKRKKKGRKKAGKKKSKNKAFFSCGLFRVLEVVCVLFSSLLFGKVSLLLYSYFKVIAHQSAFACGDKNREREKKKRGFRGGLKKKLWDAKEERAPCCWCWCCTTEEERGRGKDFEEFHLHHQQQQQHSPIITRFNH